MSVACNLHVNYVQLVVTFSIHIDILGVSEPDFQALFNECIHACNSANAHSQSATGKSHLKQSNLRKKCDVCKKQCSEQCSHDEIA